MSEAEIPNNEQELHESSQPTPAIDSSADPTDSNLSVNDPENTGMIDDIDPSDRAASPELAPVDDPGRDDAANSQLSEALTWQSDLDITELVTLSQSLQHQNSELLGHVEQLEKLLDECHSALQLQMKRNQTLETRLGEQNQEIAKTQEQLTRLFRELEASHQVAQRQQILIETVTQQLENSQEQVAQLERECAQIQQRYNEQSYNLSISENTCSELRSRYERQQRYSLQLKAALDKCLEVPGSGELATNTSNSPVGSEIQYYPQNAAARLRLLLKPQPIQPWSVSEAEYLVEETISDQSDKGAAPALNLSPQAEAEEISDVAELIAEDEPLATEEPIIAPTPAIVESKAKQGDDLPDLTGDINRNINEAEEVLWEELERLTEAAIASTNITAKQTTLASPTNFDVWDDVTEESPRHSEESQQQNKSVLSEPTTSIVPVTPNEQAEDAANWPSPLVYPQRPQKKIKSLAAIDLPSFPRLGTQQSAPAK